MTDWENYGESSLTLASIRIGVVKKRPTVPQDPSDYIRCLHLIECMGWDPLSSVAKGFILNASSQYPIWKPFYEHWDELYEIYQTEKGQSTAPKTYELIQKLVDEGRK